MSSQDDDVAAILGLPSARFRPKARPRERRATRRPLLLGAGAAVLVLGAAALSLVLQHGVSSTTLQKEPSPGQTRQPSRSLTVPTQSQAALSSLPAPAGLGGEGAAAAVSPPRRAPEDALPPPPPPPSARTLAEIRSASAPRPVIAAAPSEALRAARAERFRTPPAVAPTIEEPAAETLTPVWLSMPSGEEVASAYPADALRDGAPGSVIMACLERVDGRVSDCRILDERPYGAGFGRAALRLSRRFRFSPVLVDGRPVETEVRIPYDFSVVD